MARASLLMEFHPDGIIAAGNDLRPLIINRSARALLASLGMTQEEFTRELLQAHIGQLLTIEPGEPALSHIKLRGTRLHVKSVYCRVGGQRIHCVYFAPARSAPGSGAALLAGNTGTDPLTGLLTAAGMRGAVARQILSTAADVVRYHCFYIDVIGLRNINESGGRAEGDDILVATATLLEGCFRAGDIKARLRGGRFVVLVPDARAGVAASAYRQLVARLARHNVEHRSNIRLGLSIGIATAGCASLAALHNLVSQAETLRYDTCTGEFTLGGAGVAQPECFPAMG